MDNKTLNKEIRQIPQTGTGSQKRASLLCCLFCCSTKWFYRWRTRAVSGAQETTSLVWIIPTPSGFNVSHMPSICLKGILHLFRYCLNRMTMWPDPVPRCFLPVFIVSLAKGIFWSKHILLHRGLFHRCFCNSASSGTADGLCSITCTWWSLLSGGFFLDEDEESEVTNLWLWAQNFLKTAQSYPQYVDNYEGHAAQVPHKLPLKMSGTDFHYWPIQSNGSIQKIL